MSDVIFILGRAGVYLTTPDVFRGVSLASKVVRTEVLVHVEVVKLQYASHAAIATVFACRQLTTLNLLYCYITTALSDPPIGSSASLVTLGLYCCGNLTALPDRLGDCTALMTLDLLGCCSLIALPEWIGDCTALTTLDLTNCEDPTALPERIGDCAVLTTLDLFKHVVLVQPHRATRAARRLHGAHDAGPDELRGSHRASRAARRLRGAHDAEPVGLLWPHRASRAARRLRGADDIGSAGVPQPSALP